MNDIQTTTKVKGVISELKKQFFEEINKFYQKHLDIMNQENKPLDERLKEVSELIEEYKSIINNETSRNAQREHKNNDSPLARNRFIIEAELKQHLMNYDDNWDHNQHEANGKYTLDKKNEWIEKKNKLERELENTQA